MKPISEKGRILDGQTVPVAIVHAGILCALVITGTFVVHATSQMPTKFFVAACLALAVGTALIALHRYSAAFSLFAFVVLGAFATQYRLLSQHNLLGSPYSQEGFAIGEPVIVLSDIPLVIFLGIAFFRVFQNKQAFPKWTGLDTAVAVFLAACALSLFNAQDYSLAFFELARYVKYALAYAALRILLRDRGAFGILVAAIAVSLAFEGLVAIAQYYFDVTVFSGGVSGLNSELSSGEMTLSRVTGSVGASNTLGSWLVFPVALLTASLFSGINRRRKFFLAGALLMGFFALVLTFSRGGWVGTTVSVAVVLVTMAFRKRLSAAHVAAMTGVLIAFCGVVLFLGLGPAIAARLTNADSINARYEYNEVGGMMFLDHPFFGAGLNNFRVESYHYDPTGLSSVFDAVPHNVFVLFASETGAFGLMCFVVIGLLLLWRAVALTKQPGDDKAFLVGSFSIAYLLGIAVSNMVDATLRFEPLIVQATLVAALVLSAGSWVSGPRDRKKESKLPVLGGFL